MSEIEKRTRRRHDGSEYTTWRVRWTDDAGNRRSQTVYSKEGAKLLAAQLTVLQHRDELADVDRGRQTVADFAARWWEEYAAVNLQRNTLRSYAALCNAHILPRLGHLQLRRMTAGAISQFRVDLERAGVGPQSIRKTMLILQGMLARAVEWDELRANPAREVRKPRAARTPVVALSPAQVEDLRDRLPTLCDRTLVSLMAYGGLRPEEAFALDVASDIRAHTLHVRQRNIDGQLVAGLKNGWADRSVDLLSALRQDLAEFQISGGPRRGVLIVRADGEPWRLHDFQNWRRRVFTAAAFRAGLPGITPYTLRHSFASLLLRDPALSPAEVAAQMGHSVGMLLSTYAHVIAELKGLPPVTAGEAIRQARQNRSRSTG